MNAAFTVCSLNYLPQALTLADSVKLHAPHWKFFIGLVDTLNQEQKNAISNEISIIPVGDSEVEGLEQMAAQYNIVELCTAVKPSFFRFIFAKFPEIDQLHYLDPDTCLFNSPAAMENALDSASVLLTPHHYTPIPLDGEFPAENLALNHGIYNLGYLGLRRSATATHLIDWWAERMRDHCKIDLREGWFVDQLFFNYVPIYFQDVSVLRHPGVNAAFWNYHERSFLEKHRVLFSGEDWPLVLYHFSGFSPLKKDAPTKVKVRVDWPSNPGLRDLLAVYAEQLLSRDYENVRAIPSYYRKFYDAQSKMRRRAQRPPMPVRLARRIQDVFR